MFIFDYNTTIINNKNPNNPNNKKGKSDAERFSY
jgi:hypothetical protein